MVRLWDLNNSAQTPGSICLDIKTPVCQSGKGQEQLLQFGAVDIVPTGQALL